MASPELCDPASPPSAPGTSAGEHAAVWRALARVDAFLARFIGQTIHDRRAEDLEFDRLLRELALDRAAPEAATDAPSVDDWPGPLAGVARAFDLSPFELDVLALALAPELDGRYGALLAHLPGNLGAMRPTVSAVLDLLCAGSDPSGEQRAHRRGRALKHLLPSGHLCRYHLLAIEGAGPFVHHALRIPDPVWPRLAGLVDVGAEVRLLPARPGALDALVLPEPVRDRARAIASWLASHPAGRHPLVIVRGPPGTGRDALARGLTGAAGLPALVASGRDLADPAGFAALRRDARWAGAAVIASEHGRRSDIGRGGDEAAPESREARDPAVSEASIARLIELERPVVWIAEGRHERLLAAASRAGQHVLEVVLERPDLPARAALWRHLLPADRRASDIDPGEFAGRYRFGPARIHTAVSLADTRARALCAALDAPDESRAEPARIDAHTLEHVCRSLPEVQLGHRARKLARPYHRDDLVVRPNVRADLDLALAWGRHRTRVLHEWRMGERVHAGLGLTCLFAGPPGTGKTMAAQVLARELGLDIYRIDLSQVVNKYIGETEKNLSTLFDEADAGNLILFFDEAEALFGKRTEVKDAHDRYANVETGFLLQRLESHEGVVILATNLRRNLDDAFTRRVQIIIEFPMPEPAERKRLWRRLLPDSEHLSDDIDLDLLANTFPLSGGEIVNAVLAAAFSAAADGAIAMRHLTVGIWREMQKAGRLLEPAAFGPWEAHIRAHCAR